MKKELKIIYENIIKPAGKAIYDSAKYTGKFVYDASIVLLAIPTIVREFSDFKKSIIVSSVKEGLNKEFRMNISFLVGGLLFGLSAVTVPLTYYNNKIDETTALLLLTPLATNIASGTYEIWRYAKNKAKASVSIKVSTIPASTSGLEKKIEEKQKHEIPNPWDIEIDEIEDLKYGRLNDYGGRK